MGGMPWTDFKILIDFVISYNISRPLERIVCRHMDSLRGIRNLIVDFGIFGAVPLCVWSEFYRLEELAIVIYPFEHIIPRSWDMDYEFERDPEFAKP
jgi:hypothetical protein